MKCGNVGCNGGSWSLLVDRNDVVTRCDICGWTISESDDGISDARCERMDTTVSILGCDQFSRVFELQQIVQGHKPNARLIGNFTAGEIDAILSEYTRLGEQRIV